jgi:hypothetical protein
LARWTPLVHLTFVPLGGIQVAPDELRVPVTKEQVQNAPNIEQHGEELSQADESALYPHYELNYTPTHHRKRTPARAPLTLCHSALLQGTPGCVSPRIELLLDRHRTRVSIAGPGSQ